MVSFTRTLLVHWIQFLSSTAQGGVDKRDWKSKKIGKLFYFWEWHIPKILKILMWLVIPGKIRTTGYFWFIRMVLASESNTKFHFSTNFDQKTSKPFTPNPEYRPRLETINWRDCDRRVVIFPLAWFQPLPLIAKSHSSWSMGRGGRRKQLKFRPKLFKGSIE